MTDRIKLIQNLLNKATNPAATEAESEAFFDKAQELMTKYAIAEAEVWATTPQALREKPSKRIIYCEAPNYISKSILLAGLAKNNNCRAIKLQKQGKRLPVVVYGFESDLERIEALFASLLIHGQHELVKARRLAPHVHGKTFSTSFWDGYSGRIYRRLEEARKRAEKEAGPSTALVLYDKSEEVNKALAGDYPRLRTSSRYANTGAGYGAGAAAGSSAELDRPLGGTRKELAR